MHRGNAGVSQPSKFVQVFFQLSLPSRRVQEDEASGRGAGGKKGAVWRERREETRAPSNLLLWEGDREGAGLLNQRLQGHARLMAHHSGSNELQGSAESSCQQAQALS